MPELLQEAMEAVLLGMPHHGLLVNECTSTISFRI